MEKQNFNNLPSVKELKKAINEIEETNFSYVSYNKLFAKLRDLQFIPMVTAKLKKGHFIERGRINNLKEMFTSENQISYRTDYHNIKTYGRANIPNHSLFYGAYKTDVIEHPRLVNLLETSEIFRNLEKNNDKNANFNITVGKWRIKEDFEVVEMVFDENSIKKSSDVKRSYQYHLNKMIKDYPEQKEQFELILQFFSNQFAKKNINSHFDYMISAAYTDISLNLAHHKGIIYPSVKTDYLGQNVVLTPFSVEKYLELEIVAMFRVAKKGKESLISPIKHTTDFGPLNTEFKWLDSILKDIKVDDIY